jgi:hypothetical protein
MGWGHLTIFSRTIGTILTKLDTNPLLWFGIQNCSDEGQCPRPRGDKSKSKNTMKIVLDLFLQNQLGNLNQT